MEFGFSFFLNQSITNGSTKGIIPSCLKINYQLYDNKTNIVNLIYFYKNYINTVLLPSFDAYCEYTQNGEKDVFESFRTLSIYLNVIMSSKILNTFFANIYISVTNRRLTHSHLVLNISHQIYFFIFLKFIHFYLIFFDLLKI